ncbi:restriction endonuclease subunit S [Aliidiomarina quisquiliarum]|uniref:restriction endonuclease subunit S n=1 Tax=Aliidiomarina quisquiliarum TaxID=2938947 RepID=UPI00208E259A|nr:restriction endonuclease subunit S [Aliidiomarina quisquiliarum]MCO4322328.1 restriction endonuclease subunit S [Aliidiomarina quisquiliarum]
MVPNGWKHKAFGEVVKLSKSKYDPKKSTACFPCIELEHIVQETGQLTGNVPASNLGSTKNKFKAGDVIFGKLRPYLRKYAQPNFDGVCSSEIWVFSPTKKIINPYLFQLVQTNQFISEANKSAGSKMPRADWGVVSEMIFPLPPLPEQRKIAKILSTWDNAISTTESLIDNSKQQKKALMQQLLTGKKRLLDESGKPFEGEWEEVKLGQITEFIKDGTHGTHKRYETGVPMLSAANITKNHKICFEGAPFISEVDYQKIHAKYEISVGDILLTVVGTLGRVAIVEKKERFTLQRSVAIIRASDGVDNRFLMQLFSSNDFNHLLVRKSNSTAQAGVYLGELAKIKILLPAIEEQEKIASVLVNADQETELLEQQLADLKQEKKALMQQLLTGKKRVKI